MPGMPHYDLNYEDISDLDPIAQQIVRDTIARLRLGRERHGYWKDNDGKDYDQETREEIADALIYVAKKIIEMQEKGNA
jgi:HEPN domain-containing protein